MLPAELRVMIWTMALPGPQVITVSMRNPRNLSTQETLQATLASDIVFQIDSNTAISLSLACMEAQAVVNTHYRPLFPSWPSSQILFDPKFDMIYFPTHYAVKMFLRCDSQFTSNLVQDYDHVKKMAIALPPGRYLSLSYNFYISKVVLRFRNVRPVLFVNRSPTPFTNKELGDCLTFLRHDMGGRSLDLLNDIGVCVVEESALMDDLSEQLLKCPLKRFSQTT